MAPKKAVEEKSRRARESLKADGGKDGVAAAKEIGKLKGSSTTSSRAVTTVQNAMGRAFTFAGGAFVDSAIKGGEKTITVQAYSDAWFAALRAMPSLKEALALGESVKVLVAPGKVLVVTSSAAATTEAQVSAFLK